MCRLRRQEPCNPHCPNAEEEPLICTDCGDEILIGHYVQIGDEIICEDCLFDMNGFDLAERLGLTEFI